MQHHLFVVAQAVQEIEHWVAARFLLLIAWRQQNAVRNCARQNFTFYVLTFCAAGCLRRLAGKRPKQQCKKKQPDPCLIHTAGPPPDSAAPHATPDRVPPPGSPQSKMRFHRKSATLVRKTRAQAADSAAADTNSFPTSPLVRSASPYPPQKFRPLTPSRLLPRRRVASHRDPPRRVLSAHQSLAAAPESPLPAC